MDMALVTAALFRRQDKILITAVVPFIATDQRHKKCTNFTQRCHFMRVLSFTEVDKPVQ